MSSAGIDIAVIADSRTSVPEIARSRVPDLEVRARSSRRWGRTLIWLRKHSRSCLSETARWPECLRGSHALALPGNCHSKLTCGRGICSRFGQPAWKQARHGITLVGSETNHVLRVEKGFASLGHEVDGTVVPFDLGMNWIMSKSEGGFAGRRSVLLRRESLKPRRELVGLLAKNPKRMLAEGAPLTPMGKKSAAEGFVTASVWSVVHERPISLALLADGRRRMGESVFVHELDDVAEAAVVAPCFYDPPARKMRG